MNRAELEQLKEALSQTQDALTSAIERITENDERRVRLIKERDNQIAALIDEAAEDEATIEALRRTVNDQARRLVDAQGDARRSDERDIVTAKLARYRDAVEQLRGIVARDFDGTRILELFDAIEREPKGGA